VPTKHPRARDDVVTTQNDVACLSRKTVQRRNRNARSRRMMIALNAQRFTPMYADDVAQTDNAARREVAKQTKIECNKTP